MGVIQEDTRSLDNGLYRSIEAYVGLYMVI